MDKPAGLLAESAAPDPEPDPSEAHYSEEVRSQADFTLEEASLLDSSDGKRGGGHADGAGGGQ